LIGALNYGRMKSHGYKKDGSFTMWMSLFAGFWARQKNVKYSNVGLCWKRMIELWLFEMHKKKNVFHT